MFVEGMCVVQWTRGTHAFLKVLFLGSGAQAQVSPALCHVHSGTSQTSVAVLRWSLEATGKRVAHAGA